VPNLPAYIISDTHLGVAHRDVEKSLLRFLKGLEGRAGSLIINGDLFDFWFEWKSVLPRTGFRVIAALADLHEAGVEILWVAGNHDCWGGEILRDDVGAKYFTNAWDGNLGQWSVRVEHGDGLRDQEDRGYRMIRPVMRSPLAIRALRAMHPDMATRIAMGSSGASRTYRARDGGEGLRRIALEKLTQNPALDLLVFGHSHVATLERATSGGIFGNAGSWLDAPTYLVVSDSLIELREADGSAEGNCLNSLDRRT
jgi:UDP-2,3-diacylglucosamine hydrolase